MFGNTDVITMTTIKSFTDISQSKKLAEFLPLESADMRYGYIAPYDYSDRMYDGGYDEIPYPKDFLIKNPNFSANEYDGELPCWSLATLLSVIRETIGYTIYGVNNVYMSCDLGDEPWKLETEVYDNPVDACVEMIEKLNELNLL